MDAGAGAPLPATAAATAPPPATAAATAPSPSSEAIHDANSNRLYAMSKRLQGHFPHVPVINCSTLKRAMDDRHIDGMIIVDVRETEEWEVSRLPGSLSAAEFEAQRADFEGKTVVCYCTVGYRSSAYAAKLRQQGWEAKNLEGGVIRWSQKRYPLVTRSTDASGGAVETETKRVHVYGKPWALQPADYEPVYFKHGWLRRMLPTWLGGKR